MEANQPTAAAQDSAKARRLSEAEAYQHVASNMAFGIIRLLNAQLFFTKTSLDAHKNFGPALRDPEKQFAEDFAAFINDPTAPRETPIGARFRHFEYVTKIGYFVYATTLFDTFLSDTTRFLLLRSPSALGEECRVPIGVLVSSASRAKVINEEVSRKVRSLAAYNGFEQRLEFLKSKFAMKFDIASQVGELRRFTELRNKLVHDEAAYGFELDQSQRNTIIVKGNLFAPANISDEDVNAALSTYEAVYKIVYASVLRDVLGG